MEDIEIMEIWKSYDRKLEENLSLNRKNAAEITRLKVGSLLSSMKPLKIFTIFVGILWVGMGALIIINLCLHAITFVSPVFLISAGLQLLLTAIAIVVYSYQLILIHHIDLSGPVLHTQQQLANLKSSTLWVARILFLQLPLWTTFYWSEDMLSNASLTLLIVQGIVTASFTYVAVWLFLNIKLENRDKKWFRSIFEGKDWVSVIRSMELLEQINELRNEK